MPADSKREFLGQPVWVWAVAGLVTLGTAIYLYRKNAARQGAAAGTSGVAADGAPYQSGVSALYGWLLDQQSSPAPAPAPAPKPKKKPKPRTVPMRRLRDGQA